MWPFRHFGLKVVSLALAVLLWLVVSGEETVERGVRVPLELQQFPEGLELVGDAPASVDVRIRGASGTVSRVAAGDIVVLLDLRGARPGRRLFHLTPEQVQTPSGVEVVQVSPATVAMVFENTATRSVPIAPVLEGQPADGYVVGTVTADPPSVEVVGPENAIARLTEVATEPVSIQGAKTAIQETVTVGPLDPSIRLKSQRSATVMAHIVRAPVERVVHDRPVSLRNLASNLTANVVPPVVDVSLRGDRDVLSRIDAAGVNAYVDLSGLTAGKYRLPVHVDNLRDASVAQVTPSAIEVRISSAKN